MTTVRNTGPAVLNAMVATTVGFAVLFITPIPILGGFAITAITGMYVPTWPPSSGFRPSPS